MAINNRPSSYSFLVEANKRPIAVVLPTQQEVVVGSIVKLDARSSVDPEGEGLTYSWVFSQVPIGSQVNRFGFTALEEDLSIVSFAPDITGTYKIELVVSDGSISSEPATAIINTRVILVPHHQGIIPDASWIWNYLSDFWARVEGRKRFEVFWSSAIQIISSQLLELYQNDYNKSIRDIQEVAQKRWLYYSPALELDSEKTSFILSEDEAGLNASTTMIDPASGLPLDPQPDYSNLVIVPYTEGDFESTSFGAVSLGRVLLIGGRTFTLFRAGNLTVADLGGVDGETVIATAQFKGSGFTAAMVGKILRVLSGTLKGDYTIATFVSSTTITLSGISGGTWAGNVTGLSYSVLPTSASHSAFYSEDTVIKTGLQSQSWRFSPTLISTEHDFEAMGVHPGDLVEVEITRTDINLSATLFVQVVSVDGNRLGFVWNTNDLVEGTDGGTLSDIDRVSIASALQVQGLLIDKNNALVYTGESAAVRNTVNTVVFKRRAFETELTPETEIDVGAFSVLLRPVRVIRNHSIPVHEDLVSAPILQEYVKQPTVVEDGDGFKFLGDGEAVFSTREPFILSENLDFIIDDESRITGVCDLTNGVDDISIPFGDLLDRSLQEDDVITVVAGINNLKFYVRRVVDSETLRVSPTPSVTAVQAPFVIERRVGGRYMRFVRGVFTKKNPAPKRLWAEVSYFDNNKAIEDNFGVLVGVNKEDISSVGSTIPYKSAVAGLMYALANGPTVRNLELAGQILLGLPFTQQAGVIVEINPDFRKRPDGSPFLGRILIEARDKSGTPTGVTNIYTYPLGAQLPDPNNPGGWLSAVPDFSGLAINPDTGNEYAVGDEVGQFVALSKGVQIQDYIATPDWQQRLVAQGNVASLLQKYHSFQLLVNSDLVSTADIDLAASFMKKTKPHYTKLTAGLLKVVQDVVEIEDDLTFIRPLTMFDTPGLGLPSAVKFDNRDEDDTIISVEGVVYKKFLDGEDLQTLFGSGNNVTSVAGGFVNARAPLGESHDTPFVRPGDYLFIMEGDNAGRYKILTVTGDDQVIPDNTASPFKAATNQVFKIYRPVTNPMWVGTVDVVTASQTVNTGTGIGVADVSVGDILVFSDLGAGAPLPSFQYRVIEVVPLTPYIRVTPAIREVTGTYTGAVVRERLLTQELKVEMEALPSSGYLGDFAAASPYIVFDGNAAANDFLGLSLARYGDLVIPLSGAHVDEPFMVLQNEPGSQQLLVTPTPTFTTADVPVKIVRPQQPTTPISVDILDHIPSDYLDLSLVLSSGLVGAGLTTTATSPNVSTANLQDFSDLLVKPGDYIVILSGADSLIDVGHGPGVYLIYQFISATVLQLATSLTATNGAPGISYAIRRKNPNEG